MNPRQSRIMRELAENGQVHVAEMALALRVTPATIRRDLSMLEGLGQVVRTHGSASLSPAGQVQFHFAERASRMSDQKRLIAAATVQRELSPGMTVVLDTGTTTLEVAKLASRISPMTFLTNSLAVAAELHAEPGLELVLLGGQVRQSSPDLGGILTETNLARFKVDLAVIGADGVLADGAYCSSLSVARVTHAMIAAAKRTVLVCDSSKFDLRPLYRHAEWGEIAAVYCDRGITAAHRRWFKAITTELVLA